MLYGATEQTLYNLRNKVTPRAPACIACPLFQSCSCTYRIAVQLPRASVRVLH
jgi:hypothetical protein